MSLKNWLTRFDEAPKQLTILESTFWVVIVFLAFFVLMGRALYLAWH